MYVYIYIYIYIYENPGVIAHLLNRIGEFSEWGLIAVLDLVSRYTPSSEEEMFGVMNLLDPVLRTANSGAVLATVKCFINLTSSRPDMQPQVFLRAKAPIMTVITGSQAEVQYTMLKHLQLLSNHAASRGKNIDTYVCMYIHIYVYLYLYM
jgi:vesicle coat complex subunit